MLPTIGRIVIYHDKGIDRPAIVTWLWETSINLVVFLGAYNKPTGESTAFCETSVLEGSESGQWSWPHIGREIPGEDKMKEEASGSIPK